MVVYISSIYRRRNVMLHYVSSVIIVISVVTDESFVSHKKYKCEFNSPIKLVKNIIVE